MASELDKISLPEKDYLSILDVVAQFNACKSLDELKRTFQDILLPMFDCQAGLFGFVDPDINTPFMLKTVGYSDQELSGILGYFGEGACTFSANFRNFHRGVGGSDVDIPRTVFHEDMERYLAKHPEIERKKNRFFDVYKSGIALGSRPGNTEGIGIHRWEGHDKLWTLRDIRVLDLMRPHILNSVRTVLLWEELERYKSLADLLSQSNAPLAMIREFRQVGFCSRAFGELLSVESGDWLPIDLSELMEREVARRGNPDQIESGVQECAFYTIGGHTYRVMVDTLDRENTVSDPCWLLRFKPLVDSPSQMSLLMHQAQLTQREIEVCILTCDGFANQEIGDRLFISPHTVKTHLRKVFSKLKVGTRLELINTLNQAK